MNKKYKNEKIKKKQNNRGSAVVLVIVVLALMGIMVSLVLYMSMANFQMKANDLQSKDNFYSAEQILDEIRVGLQGEASEAIDIAYMDVIQKYELRSADPAERKKEFTIVYMDKLKDKLKDGTDDSKYDIKKLRSFVQTKLLNEGDTIADHVGAQVEVSTDNLMTAYTDSLVLQNIRVTYKDKKGYVSIITTDLRIAIPDISFESSLKIPEIIDYSLVANDKLIANNKTTISGSVYGGRNGILAEAGKAFYFKDSEEVITPDLVTAEGGTIEMDKDTNLWAGGTQVKGGSLSLLGNSYIMDDTTVLGDSSKLYISGKYMGLGLPANYTTSTAEEGSSIIINGTKSEVVLGPLDGMTETEKEERKLQRLLLPGNAYIGVNHYRGIITPAPTGQPTPTPTRYIQTNGDVALGESLTAKASQIAYLVPSECIGYVRKDAASKFECVLGTNPVLYSDYEDKFLSASSDNRVEVDFSKGGIDYATKYGAKFRQKYVRTTDGNVTLIYYYMTFNSQEEASAFFYDYFSENEERISQYLDIYVSTLKIDDIERLNVAGNLLKKTQKTDATGNPVTDSQGNAVYTYELVKETKSSDNAAGMDYSKEISTYKSVYEGLCTKLIKNANSLTQEEKDRVDKSKPDSTGIFYNLIDKDMFDKLCNSVEFKNAGNRAEFVNTVEGVKAVVVNNKGQAAYQISNLPNTTSLLVASGDVIINETFEGCIISGGTITVNCSDDLSKGYGISNDKEMIRHVLNMTTPFTINGVQTDISVMDLFIDGMSVATSAEGSADKESQIVVEDLVTYDNWSKE